MRRNIGRTDRIIRVVVGSVIIGAGIYSESWWGAIGIAPILTAVAGWTPVYILFGISTCAREPHDSQNRAAN